jgi:hypothetical protein
VSVRAALAQAGARCAGAARFALASAFPSLGRVCCLTILTATVTIAIAVAVARRRLVQWDLARLTQLQRDAERAGLS